MIGPKANSESRQKGDAYFVSEIPKLKKLAIKKGLVGLANDTKWNELLSYFRNIPENEQAPAFRCKCIESEYISEWDSEWFYHLPFPFISVLWFDISFENQCSINIEAVVKNIGFEYSINNSFLRIFAYSPKDYASFNREEST